MRHVGVAVTLALLGANLVAFSALISRWDVARLDLTRDQAFSISGATRKLVSSLDDDLTIYGYFSKRTHPKPSRSSIPDRTTAWSRRRATASASRARPSGSRPSTRAASSTPTSPSWSSTATSTPATGSRT
ncbi:MAG: hypothetical protein E6K72_02180 [Candidatus Eisenbacteria bacterium]|uniref:Uncharacterized protein n=1 Tax=Eiseniibacteriota bacterium TaxID=2212470 RepID=A0A538T5C8_UNCEI|nr:MAG: hypothetical protein E6K72_02180 [Candidatus Eisenbacteria bacterium]